VNATPEEEAGLRGLLEEVWAVIERADPAGLPAEEANHLGEALLRAVVRVSPGCVGSARPSRRLRVDRGRIVSRFEEILDGLPAEPVYVPALGAALGVPERTLRFVFAEQYGAGPVEVVRSRRLCQAHRALLDALPGARVGEVANRFGFRHLGQFAADYRALLGESPSETRRGALVRADIAELPDWSREIAVSGELAAV
jgi:AraC family ethanolamine operon transcriptional activator